MLQVNLFQNKVLEKMAKTQVGWPICFEQIEVQRLKKQATIKHITGPHIIAVALNSIRPRCKEFDGDCHGLFVAPDFELDRVALEFPFDHFLKVRALAFQFDIRIACDGMIIDREKNIPSVKDISDAGATTVLRARHDRHLSIRKSSLGWFCSFE